MSNKSPKVAVVHDWLYTYAGAERVLEQILLAFPEAEIHSLIDFLPDEERHFLTGRPVRTSFLQSFPFMRTRHRSWLPLFPLAIESLDLSSYDIIISSSYSVAKGVMASPTQRHVCYCHSPMRYAWDLQPQYLRETGMDRGLKGLLAKVILHYLRIWDVASTNRVDTFIANSAFISARIRRCYGRAATVIHPPVATDRFELETAPREEYFVTASRMVPYKKIDLIVEAFTHMPDKRLVVIGDGPGMAAIRKIATPNIQLLGSQPHVELKRHLQHAKAFLFAAEEDFGIAPVEAQACGTPVLAFGKGGALETIRGLEQEHPTGHFFPLQTCESLIEELAVLEANLPRITPQACRANAERFAPQNFRKALQSIIG